MPRTYDTPQEPDAPDYPISYDKNDHRFSKTQGVWWAGDKAFPTSRQARVYARELQEKRTDRDALRHVAGQTSKDENRRSQGEQER